MHVDLRCDSQAAKGLSAIGAELARARSTIMLSALLIGLLVLDQEFLSFLSVLFIALGVMGVLILILAPQANERLKRIGVAYFAGGMAGVVATFLFKNPDVLEWTERHIALTLIGLVIATISVIRLLHK